MSAPTLSHEIVNSPSSTGTWFSGADLDSGCLDAGVFLVALAGLEAGLGYIVSSFNQRSIAQMLNLDL